MQADAKCKLMQLQVDALDLHWTMQVAWRVNNVDKEHRMHAPGERLTSGLNGIEQTVRTHMQMTGAACSSQARGVLAQQCCSLLPGERATELFLAHNVISALVKFLHQSADVCWACAGWPATIIVNL